ncbi:Gfo/Idh/MocA family protein [Herbaspirillum robiniae]|uniref:Gfo/Idh/MocA family protein n=1 Tax=Herbaspirillum robiniae TaxID=2014887 RepID=UPI003D77FE3F
MNPGTERYLIVSLGSIGRRHLRNLRTLRPTAEIAVLRLHSSTEDIPEGADYQFTELSAAVAFAPCAAIVAGPATTHVVVCTALVTAGIPVLTEKPLSNQLENALEFATLARQRQVGVTIGYNLRFLPSLQESRRLVLGGAIGTVRMVRAEVGQYLPDWRPDQDYKSTVSAQTKLGGGVLLELSHEIDYLCWILGIPDRVIARGGNMNVLDIAAEEAVELCLEYAVPPKLVNVHLDFLQRAPTRVCKFIGDDGTLIWNGIEDRVDMYRADTREWTQIDVPKMTDRNQMYLDEVRNFLNAPNETGLVACHIGGGLDVLSVIEAAKESMQTHAVTPVQHHGR